MKIIKTEYGYSFRDVVNGVNYGVFSIVDRKKETEKQKFSYPWYADTNLELNINLTYSLLTNK